jgi:uncharacterized protein
MLMRVGLLTFGWSLMGVGVAGLFLPILPGILLILIALTILSTEYHWARRVVAKLGQKYPEADRKLQRLLGKYARVNPPTNSTSSGD